MIAKVYGTANNEEISFRHIRGDLWQADVPTNLRGEWLCDLYAENEAGKTAFAARRLLAISGHKVRISLIPRSYSIRLAGKEAQA